MEEDVDCSAVLRKAGIISRTGTVFEASSRYTRLSLIKTQDDFDLLLRRMEALVSKEGVASFWTWNMIKVGNNQLHVDLWSGAPTTI